MDPIDVTRSNNTAFNANYTARPFNGFQNEIYVNGNRVYNFSFPPGDTAPSVIDGETITKNLELWAGESRYQSIDLTFAGMELDRLHQNEHLNVARLFFCKGVGRDSASLIF